MLPIAIFLLVIVYVWLLRPQYIKQLDIYSRHVLMDEMPPKKVRRKLHYIEIGLGILALALFASIYYFIYEKTHQ